MESYQKVRYLSIGFLSVFVLLEIVLFSQCLGGFLQSGVCYNNEFVSIFLPFLGNLLFTTMILLVNSALLFYASHLQKQKSKYNSLLVFSFSRNLLM